MFSLLYRPRLRRSSRLSTHSSTVCFPPSPSQVIDLGPKAIHSVSGLVATPECLIVSATHAFRPHYREDVARRSAHRPPPHAAADGDVHNAHNPIAFSNTDIGENLLAVNTERQFHWNVHDRRSGGAAASMRTTPSGTTSSGAAAAGHGAPPPPPPPNPDYIHPSALQPSFAVDMWQSDVYLPLIASYAWPEGHAPPHCPACGSRSSSSSGASLGAADGAHARSSGAGAGDSASSSCMSCSGSGQYFNFSSGSNFNFSPALPDATSASFRDMAGGGNALSSRYTDASVAAATATQQQQRHLISTSSFLMSAGHMPLHSAYYGESARVPWHTAADDDETPALGCVLQQWGVDSASSTSQPAPSTSTCVTMSPSDLWDAHGGLGIGPLGAGHCGLVRRSALAARIAEGRTRGSSRFNRNGAGFASDITSAAASATAASVWHAAEADAAADVVDLPPNNWPYAMPPPLSQLNGLQWGQHGDADPATSMSSMTMWHHKSLSMCAHVPLSSAVCLGQAVYRGSIGSRGPSATSAGAADNAGGRGAASCRVLLSGGMNGATPWYTLKG